MICEVSLLYSIAYFRLNLNSENAKICADHNAALFGIIAVHNGRSVLPQIGGSCYYRDRLPS